MPIFPLDDLLTTLKDNVSRALRISGEVSVVGSSINVSNVLNVTIAGTRVQLPDISCREITIIARSNNTGIIYVGDSLVSSSRFGIELSAKEKITFNVANANQIWIDASVSGEGISYIAV
jgi:hypothetical protein